MKTALIVLTIGFVSIAVLVICVLSIVTSTTRGAEWIQGKSEDRTADPEDAAG
jgi:hypothetical protein